MEKSGSEYEEAPDFPWVRSDAGKFIWEEIFLDNNYLAIHYSASGRGQSREKIFNKLKSTALNADNQQISLIKRHLYAFELEVNGQLLRDYWEWVSAKVEKDADGVCELIVELSYSILPISLKIHTRIDSSQFMVRWLEIINDGMDACCISGVYPWCGIICYEEEDTSISARNNKNGFLLGRYKNDNWCMEGEFVWEKMREGTFKVETFKRYFNPPSFVVKNEKTGELTTILFEWSGNMQVEFSNCSRPAYNRYQIPWKGNYLYARVGVSGPSPHYILEPGEAIYTPSVHLSMTYGDLDVCVNNLYDHLRESVLLNQPECVKNLVEYNHSGYTLNAQISNKLLYDEIDMAAKAGIELLMVDAGWFGAKEKNWFEAVGDWYENPLLEGKLTEIFDYASQKGMKHGLWVEIERAGRESEFTLKHPDWFIKNGNSKSEILDITIPEVEEYVFGTISNLIEKYSLDCFRIDHNYEQFSGGERLKGHIIENTLWKYFNVFYQIFERISRRFPDLLLENCSSGGGRTDLGIMRRFHWTQVTDNWNPPQQIRIFNGMTICLPPEQCMSIVGAINMHSADIDFVIRAGMFGHFCVSGIFPTVDKANLASLARWKHGIELYKEKIRPLLSNCKVYHHTSEQNYSKNGDWVVLEYTDGEATSSIVGLFRLLDSRTGEYKFMPKGLNRAKKYALEFDNSGLKIEMSGAELFANGVLVNIKGQLMSEIVIIKQIERPWQ